MRLRVQKDESTTLWPPGALTLPLLLRRCVPTAQWPLEVLPLRAAKLIT